MFTDQVLADDNLFYEVCVLIVLILIFYMNVFDIALTGVYTRDKGPKIEFSPTVMEHVVTEETAGRCYSVSWTAHGNVVCTGGKLMRIRSGDDRKIITTVTCPSHVDIADSSALRGGKLYTKLKTLSENRCYAYSGTNDDPAQRVLHCEDISTVTNSKKLVRLAASNAYIVSIDYENGDLKVFSAAGNEENLFDIGIKYDPVDNRNWRHPFAVCLTSDEAVLVTDLDRGILFKFKLEPTKTEVWRCRDRVGFGGITVDEAGFIYVTNTDHPFITVVSPDGEWNLYEIFTNKRQ